MKTLPLCLALGLLFLNSCKKSNSGKGASATPYYLSSVVAVSLHRRFVDSFYYDTLHRVDTFTQVIYDTTSGTPMFNTWTVQFLYQDANTTAPSWYNFYDAPLGGYGDYHLLSYDGSDRITKDTSLSGSGYVTYYSYPSNNLAATTLFEGTPDNNVIDTLYLFNGDVGKEVDYSSVIPGQPDQFVGEISSSYESIANPAYHAAISGSIGPLLNNLAFNNGADFVDFISKDSRIQSEGDETSSSAPVVVNFTLTTDSKGRLAKMTAGSGASTILFSYY